MPSRKKKQGRARKAKQAETRSSNPNNAASHCDHFECSRNSNWSQDDYAAAIKLSIEFSSKFNALVVGSSSSDLVRMAKDHARMVYLVDEVYQKYFQLSDGGKEIFRNYILAYGTEVLVDKAKVIDLTKEPFIIINAYHTVFMIKTMEVRDSHNGAWDLTIARDIQQQTADASSPRETVRFFHRRNSCDCLKELYYKLKENTTRTLPCWNCNQWVDIKTTSQCHCSVANYCSYDCAAAHYPKHKNDCKEWTRELNR
eukprot:scaffold65279_cov48-Cyclotella_meneghiniana.AAC.2